MATKDALILVQRRMDENDQDIYAVIAQSDRLEEPVTKGDGPGDGTSSHKDKDDNGTSAHVKTLLPMPQANEARFKRRPSNMKYFVSNFDEDDDQEKIDEEASGAYISEGLTALRGSLLERQRKSWARSPPDRNDGDLNALSRPSFPTQASSSAIVRPSSSDITL